MSEEKNQHQSITKSIFGSFYLSENEFALSVDFVQEVVNAPKSYTSVPLAPQYLKGLFNLRGSIIPVLDLREILKLNTNTTYENQKVAIIELEGSCVGLLFDKTGEIFRSHEDERCDFDDNYTTGVTSGVFKKDHGQRIIQILSVKNIFNLKYIPKDSNRNRLGRDLTSKKRGSRNQCISFQVGPANCAIPINAIQEIIKVDRINKFSINSDHGIGSIDLRGSTVPIIDFVAFLKYRETDRSETATQGDRRIIIMKLQLELFGLLVDSVDSIISYFSDELVSFPLVEQLKGEMFLGCITHQDKENILLLDQEKIFTDVEINEITHGHNKIYQNNLLKEQKKDQYGGPRRTYITFNIDTTYAISIGEIREIIELPDSLLQPPGLKEHIKGVLNLRNNLITIIDARTLYQKNMNVIRKNNEVQKVLIFNIASALYGLIVDSVDSIVSFSNNEMIKLPDILYNKQDQTLSADILEAVEVTDHFGTKKSMLIVDMNSISGRINQANAA